MPENKKVYGRRFVLTSPTHLARLEYSKGIFGGTVNHGHKISMLVPIT